MIEFEGRGWANTALGTSIESVMRHVLDESEKYDTQTTEENDESNPIST